MYLLLYLSNYMLTALQHSWVQPKAAFICKACFKSSAVETQYIHNPLIHANIKGLLCSGLCGSQCVWVWRAAACVWCSRSGCTNSALRRGDAPLQLLLIRKSIWVRHQIVYVVCRKGTGTSVCVWGGAYDPSVPVSPTKQHGGRQWREAGTDQSTGTALIKTHHLNLSWLSW